MKEGRTKELQNLSEGKLEMLHFLEFREWRETWKRKKKGMVGVEELGET